MKAANIFICYRRETDAASAGRLAGDLALHFPRATVFRDVEGLAPGVDYVATIQDKLSSCAAFLPVIGPQWLEVGEPGRPRLHEPSDVLRLEIAEALKRKILVIPVLVGDATMPTKVSLPEDIQQLERHQAVEFPDRRWDLELQELVKRLAQDPQLKRLLKKTVPARRWMWLTAAGVLAALVALVAATWLTTREEPRLPDGLALVDLGVGPSCIKPTDCDTQPAESMSEMILLSGAEVRLDPDAGRLHLMLDVRWILREGPSRWFHRGYTGKLYYSVEYQRAQSGSVVFAAPEMHGYSLVPVNGFVAFAFGWVEIPSLVARDDGVTTDIRDRVSAPGVVQQLP